MMVLHALAWLVGVVVLAMVALGLVDYLVRVQDRGLRWLAWLSLCGAAVWTIARRLWPAVSTRLNDLYLAQRIERRFPFLSDTLSSAVEFLHQSEQDPEAGSVQLRRSVIQQTARATEKINFHKAVDRRPVKFALLASGWVCVIAAMFYYFDRSSTTIAVDRLLSPWNDTAWPKKNHLAIRNPVNRVPLGQPFELEVVDRDGAELPPDVKVHYRFNGSTEENRTDAMKRVGDLFVAEIAKVERPFAYRVTGGDDDTMAWHELEVVEPPVVSELQLTLHYPEYTQWPATASEPHVRAIVGTRIAIVGKSTKPIRNAVVSIDGCASFPAKVSEDGYAFELSADIAEPLVLKANGAYRIDLEDLEGFHGHGDIRYDLRAIEDRAPVVTLEQPAADGFVTPDAVVPIKIVAKEDLALQRIDLNWLRSDQSDKGTTVTSLWQGPAKATPPAADRPAGPMVPQGESRTVEHSLQLGPLKLAKGVQLTIHASASDYRPVVSQSHARRLTVVSPTELQERLAERLSTVLAELSRAQKLQRDARNQLSGVEIQLKQVDTIGKPEIDHLQQAELLQRQVERTLTSKADGVPAQVADMLSDLRNNRLEQGDTPQQMERLLNDLAQLAEKALPGASRELVSAIKGSQSHLADAGDKKTPLPKDAPTRENIAAAGKHQDEVIDSLENLLGDLSQWDTYRRFHRELGQMRRDQEQVERETAEVGAKTLSKPLKDLTQQEAADLRKLASRQAEMARQFEKTQQRMAEMVDKLRQTDPLAADTVQDAIDHAREKATAGKLSEAARNVEQNQTGQAGAQQKQAAGELQQMLDILSNRRENELGRLVKKLREAESQLDDLRKQQAGLKKKLDEANKIANEEDRKRELQRLGREQRDIQQQIDRFARQLQRLQADQASRAASRGSQKMSQAGQQAEQGDGRQAGEQAEQAAKDLEDAAQQLAERREKAEEDLANEQSAQIQQLVQELVQQQEQLLTETKHYDGLQTREGRLTRAQAQSVQDLGRQQLKVGEDTTSLSRRLTAEVFQLALEGIASDMQRAGTRLGQIDVTSATQRIQQLALNRARRLIDAFKNDDSDGNKDQKKQPEGNQGGGEGQGQSGQGRGASIAEIKLVKLLQEDLNERTRNIEQEFAERKVITSDMQRELGDLSREQGRLADLLIKLTTPEEKKKDGDKGLNDLLERDLKGGPKS